MPNCNDGLKQERMEYRGVEYRVIQGIKRGFWKWAVDTAAGTRVGTSDSRDSAVSAAKRTIDRLLDPTRRKDAAQD